MYPQRAAGFALAAPVVPHAWVRVWHFAVFGLASLVRMMGAEVLAVLPLH